MGKMNIMGTKKKYRYIIIFSLYYIFKSPSPKQDLGIPDLIQRKKAPLPPLSIARTSPCLQPGSAHTLLTNTKEHTSTISNFGTQEKIGNKTVVLLYSGGGGGGGTTNPT